MLHIRKAIFRPRTLVVLVFALFPLLPTCGAGGSGPETDAEVFDRNFPTDDGKNSFAWSMAEYNGLMYIGTNREFRCVEYATADAYGVGNYSPNPEPGVTCSESDYLDLQLPAKIYSFNHFTGEFRQVWQSPTVTVTDADGSTRQVAKYMGVRGLNVHNGVLYANTFSTGEIDPSLVAQHPPTLLRTTDGNNWGEVPNPLRTIATPLGENDTVVGYRAAASIDGRFFITGVRGLLGDGAVIEIINPESDNPYWYQVSPSDIMVYELEPFNGSLYLGTGGLATFSDQGYGVIKANPATISAFNPDTGSDWEYIVQDGAGRGAEMASVVMFDVFNDHLYVGSSGWEAGDEPLLGLFIDTFLTILDPSRAPQAELLRVDTNDNWELVVGDSRSVDGRNYSPISGLGDGFGNEYNAHLWRSTTYNGGLYMGTNDWSWYHRDIPIFGTSARQTLGYDMFYTCDGVNFDRVTKNAFGDGEFNFGLRTFAVSGDGSTLLIGSANHIEGATVWTYQGNDCG